MWRSIFLFEIKYHLRQPLFYLVTFFFSILVFMWGTSNGGGGAVGKINLNSPLIIIDLLTHGTLMGLFVVTAFVGSSAVRDFDRQTSELFFSKPVSRFDYLIGRFAGSTAVSLLMFVIGTLTLALSSFMPWLDPERVGPFMPAAYLFSLGILIVPNLFSLGATFFALAIWTRSLLVTLLGVVGFYGAYTVSRALASNLESESAAALLDPFGLAALEATAKYWTVAEQNMAIPELGGLLLYNRLLWIAVGVLALGISWLTFDPARSRNRRRKRRLAHEPAAPANLESPLVGCEQVFSRTTAVTQFLHQTRFEIESVVKSYSFLAIQAFGLIIVASGAMSVDSLFGTGVHPVTHLMLQAIEGGYAILLVIIATFYSGDMVWKQRSFKLDNIYDASPTPNAVYLGAKLTALLLIVAGFLVLGMATTLGFQAWSGHFDFELGLYLKGAMILAVYPVLMSFLAFFFQIAARTKFTGYALVIAFMVSWDLLEEFDLQHHIYRFASLPQTPYSDMNGYGHFLKPFVWYGLYWAFFSAALFGLSIMLFKRGTDTAWRVRLGEARARFRGPARALVIVGALGASVAGAFIFYNTNVLNEYLSSGRAQQRQADYEKEYRQYRDIALPRITSVEADVDIFPEARKLAIRGTYRLENKGEEPIHNLHITWPPQIRVDKLTLPPHQVKTEDLKLGYSIYQLDTPLAPGAISEMGFELAVEPRGFLNHGSNRAIVANGSYLYNRDYFPTLGYADRRQLTDREDRRRLDLDTEQRFAEIDDTFARRNTPRGADADWVELATTVSTRADQIAVAPGNLQKEWTHGDRRFFRYETKAPIPFHFAFLSAEYEVARDQWQDVAIEVYHHPDHGYNVERMISSVKKSLAYFTSNFGPYQFQQVRIAEFPRYTRAARAFPGLIAFSESIGFIAQVDEGEVDYPFYVTSHELAHQWWSHQVVGGNVQGVAMLAESLAQYSALMVMEEEYGPQRMRRFLKYELDKYLRNRGREQAEEVPLARVEDQSYIFYNKGSIAMYALKDAIGEQTLNRALADFAAKVAFQQPPFTTTQEFLDEVRRVTPKESQGLIEDLFEKIILFDNKLADATYSPLPDGTFLVRLEAEAKKLHADGAGTETEIAIDDWIDVAVFGEPDSPGKTEEKILFFEKRKISDAKVAFELVVDERPVRAGFDPYNKLVDRNSNDNMRSVSQSEVEVAAPVGR